MAIYYHEGPMGCGLLEARSIVSARKQALAMAGSHNAPRTVRRATEEDIGWVQAMGGYLPASART